MNTDRLYIEKATLVAAFTMLAMRVLLEGWTEDHLARVQQLSRASAHPEDKWVRA